MIEEAAVRAAVPTPVPLRSRRGHINEPLGDHRVRVHTWAKGAAKVNETVTATEAAAMGRIVARLHRLAVPAPARARRTGFGLDHWRRLAAARGGGAHWAEVVLDQDVDLNAGTLAVRQAITTVKGIPVLGDVKTPTSRRVVDLPGHNLNAPSSPCHSARMAAHGGASVARQ